MVKKIYRRVCRYFNDLSFKNKVLTSFILIALIPLSILGIFSYKTIKHMMINKETTYLESTFVQTSQVLNNQMDTYSNAIRSFCFNKQLISINRMNFVSNYDKYEALRFIDDLFVSTQTLIPGIKEMTLYTDSNMGAHGNTVRPVDEMEKFDWYPSLSENAANWFSEDDDIVCVHPLLDFSREKTSYIVMKISADEIEKILRSVDSKNISVAVMDEQNHTVRDNGKTDIDREMIQKMENTDQLYIEERKYVSIKTPIEDTDWMVVMSASYQEILLSTYFFSAIVILIILLCFVVVVLASIWFSKRILLRIYQLKDNMQEVEKGSFIVTVTSDSKDEIGELIHGFSKMISKINELIEKNYKATVEKKEYELKALQAQINPHFLYNSLSLINWRALRIDATEISELARLLSDFYRTTLNKGNSITVISQEMLNIKSYLQIQRIMHSNSFDVEYQIEEGIANCTIPNLTLQPLVENAILHGLEKKNADGKLIITGIKRGDDLYIVIQDNGAGIPEHLLGNILKSESRGYGLRNVNQRIKLVFGEEYGLLMDSVLGEGTRVTLKIPVQYGEVKI